MGREQRDTRCVNRLLLLTYQRHSHLTEDAKVRWRFAVIRIRLASLTIALRHSRYSIPYHLARVIKIHVEQRV